MAATGKKWLVGCGLGCGGTIVIVSALLAFGWHHYFKETVTEFRQASQAQKEVVDTLGRVDDYAPAWDGILRPERLDAFLSVQERIAPGGMQIVSMILQGHRDMERPSGRLDRLWHSLKTGSRLGPELAQFLSTRSQAMLAENMNPGQYLYLHSLIYHCWLGYDPDEGAVAFFERIREGTEDMRVHLGGDINLADDPHLVVRQLRQELNRRHQAWLRSMIETAPAIISPAEEVWLDMVRQEQARLVRLPDSMPWSESFPPAWQEVLEPHRAALTGAWSAENNLIELILQQ